MVLCDFGRKVLETFVLYRTRTISIQILGSHEVLRTFLALVRRCLRLIRAFHPI